MGSQINTNASKTGLESTGFGTFDFQKILNNDCQDPDENFFSIAEVFHLISEE